MAKYSRITGEGSKSLKIAVAKQNRNSRCCKLRVIFVVLNYSRSCCGLTKVILKDFEPTPAKNSCFSTTRINSCV